jgi:hypothetical protein
MINNEIKQNYLKLILRLRYKDIISAQNIKRKLKVVSYFGYGLRYSLWLIFKDTFQG